MFRASKGWRQQFIRRHLEVCTRVVEVRSFVFVVVYFLFLILWNVLILFVQIGYRTCTELVWGMNYDTVKKYFKTLKDVIDFVERENGHALQGNEIMNIDETGFDLCNCTKTQRVIIRTSKYKRQPKTLHQREICCCFYLCLDVANVFYLHVSFFPGQLQGRLIELIFQLLYV